MESFAVNWINSNSGDELIQHCYCRTKKRRERYNHLDHLPDYINKSVKAHCMKHSSATIYRQMTAGEDNKPCKIEHQKTSWETTKTLATIARYQR